MNDLNRKIMNVEEYFEIYTGGNDYIATWTPKALKDFAEDYHKMKMREESKENKNNDIHDVSERYILVEWLNEMPLVDGSLYFDSKEELLDYHKKQPRVDGVTHTICRIRNAR